MAIQTDLILAVCCAYIRKRGNQRLRPQRKGFYGVPQRKVLKPYGVKDWLNFPISASLVQIL